jgi:Fe-S cluster assembly ATP-binding protein
LLSYIKADRISILFEGRVVMSGGPELALELERTGYEQIRQQYGEKIMA